MIVVKLMGGLGNQMFQYAFGKNLAIKNNTHLKVDTAFLLDRTPREGFVFRDFDLDIFTLKAYTVAENEVEEFKRSKPFFSRLLSGGNSNTSIINEKVFHFDPSAIVMKKNCYASGYWQSEKYFQEIEAIIRQEFTFKTAFGVRNYEFTKRKLIKIKKKLIAPLDAVYWKIKKIVAHK